MPRSTICSPTDPTGNANRDRDALSGTRNYIHRWREGPSRGSPRRHSRLIQCKYSRVSTENCRFPEKLYYYYCWCCTVRKSVGFRKDSCSHFKSRHDRVFGGKTLTHAHAVGAVVESIGGCDASWRRGRLLYCHQLQSRRERTVSRIFG